MAELAPQKICSVCDHQMVPGVACDGQFEECPYRTDQPKAKSVFDGYEYEEEVLDLAEAGEFDAVRGQS